VSEFVGTFARIEEYVNLKMPYNRPKSSHSFQAISELQKHIHSIKVRTQLKCLQCEFNVPVACSLREPSIGL
jgi:hypothetical protein